MSDQQQRRGFEETPTLEESTTLRWEVHHMQGNTIELNLRFDDTVRTLKSRGNDREAREVLLQLAKDFKTLNDELMSQFTRLSAINRTIVEMLQKSKDGKAALMMRKAAELLVKGLANAEEEVHSLKATVAEVEAQRDRYKGLLAKTNAELETSQAYAQMSKAIGQEAGAAFSSATTTSSGGVVAGGDDAVLKKRSVKSASGTGRGGKGKAPARQVRQRTAGVVAMSTSRPNSGGGGGSGSSSTVGGSLVTTEAGVPHEEASLGASAGNAKKGKERTIAAAAARGGGSRIAIRGGASLGKADVKAASGSSGTTTTTTASRRKRQREEAEATAGGTGEEEEADQGRRRENNEGGEDSRSRSTGEKRSTMQRGVEVPLLGQGGWGGDGDGEVEGIGEAGEGGGGRDEGEGGGGEGDVQSVYDSDDAPSMFF